MIFLGYLIGSIEYGVYVFNFVHLIWICYFVLVIVIKYKKIFLTSIISSVIYASIYYLLISDFGLFIATNLIIYLLVFIQLCLNRNFIRGVVGFVISYFLILLLNIRLEILEYSFVSIDFNLCFVGLIIYSLLFVICKLFVYLILNKSIQFEVGYEKKNFYNSIAYFNF